MPIKNCFLLLLLFLSQCICAQQSPLELKEVVISDIPLNSFSNSQNVLKLKDSIISKNQPSLTSILNYNSTIYFKENGFGMVSSPSFRGTTAQQTAVIWNGININSQLIGQTDFNTISTKNFDNISIRAGGGSAIYGSSAIGGSIHLNNDLAFKNQFVNDLQVNYGSFRTSGIHYNFKASSEKFSSQFGFSRNVSENDYVYLKRFNYKGEQEKNVNGQFRNSNFSVNFGYKFNDRNCLKLYSESTNSDRNFSLISASETKTKYKNSFSRNLLDYVGNFEKFTLNLKTAYIYENYKYFPSIESDNFSFGSSENFISKIDFGFSPLKSIKINSIFDYNRTKGFGTSFGSNVREINAFSILIKQNASQKWINEFVVRKEITSNYDSPILFSVGSNYNFNSIYSLKINGSRNFRIPTFNDLYWENAGNTYLKPENSYQAEIGNVFKYKKFYLSQTFYFIKIKDLIRWFPNSSGNWSPSNTNRVQTFGAETILKYENSFRKHHISATGTYAYTISKNEETNKQLFFVPFHKFTSSIEYTFKNISLNYQFLFNGFVYTRSDNDPNEIIKSCKVSNIAFDYNFKFLKSTKLGFEIRNMLNQYYQSVEDRPMPGRNFNMYINLKF
jgi:outer membrane cobalamin receptor